MDFPHHTRMIGNLIMSGDIYAHEGRGRGHTSRYAVLTGLDDRAITDILGNYFGLTPDEVAAYLLSIESGAGTPQKGDRATPFLCAKGDMMTAFRDEKADKMAAFSGKKGANEPSFPDQKGDMLGRKGDIPSQKGVRALTPEPLTEPLHEPSGDAVLGVTGLDDRVDGSGGMPLIAPTRCMVQALVGGGQILAADSVAGGRSHERIAV